MALFNPKKIKSVNDAKNFIDRLINKGLAFHLDDEPSEIIDSKTGEYIFTKRESRRIRKIQNILFSFSGFCPHEYMITRLKDLDLI